MSSRSPVRAGASTTVASRPSRLVFRPFEPQKPAPASTNTVQPDIDGKTETSTNSSQSQDYGIDFELDDEDAKAIEQVFADYSKKLKEQQQADDTLQKESSGQQEPRLSQPRPEEDAAEQEEYHDSIALDSLLDLEFTDGELLVALDSQDLPSSQQSKGKQPTSSNTEQTSHREEWDDEDIDKQVLWEYEQWVKRTGYNDTEKENNGIVDETLEAKERTKQEEQSEHEYTRLKETIGPPPIEDDIQDNRSPLDRFRVRGNHIRLSVSDMLFNMWCEQQFHYTLLRGFKRKTVEMRAGTKIHRQMEEQIHTVVPVTVKTPHDKWGVRIWNMIQGLESLKTAGLTRELEVWGWIDGVFIGGVIDEVRFTKFNSETEEPSEVAAQDVEEKEEVKGEGGSNNVTEMLVNAAASGEVLAGQGPQTPKKRGRPRKSPLPESPKPETPAQQKSILDFVTPSPKKSRSKAKPAYVLDLKTRASYSIPKPGSSQSLSVHFQLMLYRHLLNDMIHARAASMVKKLCAHHGVPADEPFSDDLMAGLAGNREANDDEPDILLELLENNSIKKLYSLYHKKLKETISTIAPELSVVYRSQHDGDFLDHVDYLADDDMLREHIESVISWWKGGRETVGVGIEEAWKCRNCEFSEHCNWRLTKLEEAQRERRSKRIAGME